MAKLGIIGDVHSRHWWKKAYQHLEDCEQIIFLGDYVDPYEEQQNNWELPTNLEVVKILEEIIQLKKDNPERITLLLGNHDAHYLYKLEPCSRYNGYLAKTLRGIYQANEDCFQMAYQKGKYLFTHAGVSSHWLKNNREIFYQFGYQDKVYTNLAYVFNQVQKSNFWQSLHIVGECRGGFPGEDGGITWLDQWEALNSKIDNLHQIVGHSKTQGITTYKSHNGSITFCDTLHRNNFDPKIDLLKIEL